MNHEGGLAAVMRTLPSEEELEAKCIELGLVMRRPPTFDVTHPAITLFPSVMQADVLRELYAKQLLWNEAIDRTARSFGFLRDSLRETAASDMTFTGKLVEMLERVYMSPPVLPDSAKVKVDHPVFQPLMLGIFRADYMRSMDGVPRWEPGQPRPLETAEQWKNVEVNTVSCSFAALSTLAGRFHSYLRRYRNALLATGVTDAARPPPESPSEPASLEMSASLRDIPAALANAVEAWKANVPYQEFIAHYSEQLAKAKPGHGRARSVPIQPVVLVVIQEDERNTGDQYKLLFALLEQHGIVSIRRTMTQLHQSMELVFFGGAPKSASGANNPPVTAESSEEDMSSKYRVPPFAVVDKAYVASVVYFRSTYVPIDFPTAACWESRERLERCNAVKCPSLPHHLMTWKKMQQLFSLVPSVLVPVAFAGDEAKARRLACHFMEQYSLNAVEYPVGRKNEPEEHIQAAIATPSEYVLKPQLEGGGNLFAGQEMQELLKSHTSKDDPQYAKIRKEYILMKRIHSEVKDALLFRQGCVLPFEGNACSELGIFGCILSDGTENTYDPANSNLREVESTSTAEEGGGARTGTRVFNWHSGYNNRTKPANLEDGGVMAGVACLDTVMLV